MSVALEAPQPIIEEFNVEPVANAPAGLTYNGVPQAPRGIRSLHRFVSDNGSVFSDVGTNLIRIPVSSNQMLDLNNAQLEFTIQNTSGQVAWLDGGAQCVINRMRITNSSGTELERIDDYNVLAIKMDQYTESKTSIMSKGVLSGAPHRVSDTPYISSANSGAANLDSTVTTYETGEVFNIVTTLVNSTHVVTRSGTGGVGWLATDADSLDDNDKRTYSIELRGAWFNPMKAEYLVPGASFVLELTLETALTALKTAATAAYTITNPSLFIPTILITDPAFNARMEAMKSKGLSWRGLSFKSHNNNIAANAGSATVVLNDRSSNLRGLMTVARFQANLTTVGDYSLSKSSIQFYTDYQYQIGSSLYPPQKVDMSTDLTAGGTLAGTPLYVFDTNNLDIARAFSECQRFWGNLHSSGDATGIVGAENFCQSELNHGTGVLCVDLQTYSDNGFVSGINTAAQSLPISLKVQKSANANAIQELITYSLYDKVFIVDSQGNLAVID